MENKEYTQNKIKGMIEDNKLDLSFMGLTEVPRAVFMFPRISQLDLSGNRISLLPQKINSLTNLVKLDISNNKLHELPDEIGKLSKLETLDVFKNEIEDLPLTFTNLKALKYLNITENPLNDKLAKVVGDSNKPNFQKAAVPKVMEYVMGKIQEKNKQIKKQEAVREKVKKINENEKKKKKSPKVEKNENNNIVKEMKEMTPRKETTIATRQAVINMRENGRRGTEIAKVLKINKRTVYRMLKRHAMSGSVERLPRPGRPRSTTPRQDMRIVRESKANPNLTYVDICAAFRNSDDLRVSPRTICRRLVAAGLNGRRPAKKPFIGAKNRRARVVDSMQDRGEAVIRSVGSQRSINIDKLFCTSFRSISCFI